MDYRNHYLQTCYHNIQRSNQRHSQNLLVLFSSLIFNIKQYYLGRKARRISPFLLVEPFLAHQPQDPDVTSHQTQNLLLPMRKLSLTSTSY